MLKFQTTRIRLCHCVILGTIVLLLSFSEVSGQSSPSPSPTILVVPPTLDALSIANLFREGKFEDVRAHLSNTLNLSADQLKDGWQAYI